MITEEKSSMRVLFFRDHEISGHRPGLGGRAREPHERGKAKTSALQTRKYPLSSPVGPHAAAAGTTVMEGAG
jgi:hypothetical protein